MVRGSRTDGLGVSVEIVTYWSTLLRLAHEEAEARKAGDPAKLAAAEARHADYAALCARPGVRMVLPEYR